jgi:glycosyltransferase involved in cell wall biosynthesis
LNEQIRPKITIGLPVYNGEQFIHHAIDSLLRQSYANFKLIISDNASTDKTELICKNFVRMDKRVSYVRHNINRGYIWNSNYVLKLADTEYFMWAAADDVWHPEFIQKNLMFLEKNPSFVGSISEMEFFYEPWQKKDFDKFKNIKPEQKYQIVCPFVGKYEEKVKFLFSTEKTECIYAIYRTKHLKKSMIKRVFLSCEIPIILKVLKYGDLNVEEEVMMYKNMCRKKNPNFYKKLFSTTKNYWKYGILQSIFPFVPLTLYVLAIVGPKIFFKYLLIRFIKDNYRAERLVFLELLSRVKTW